MIQMFQCQSIYMIESYVTSDPDEVYWLSLEPCENVDSLVTI